MPGVFSNLLKQKWDGLKFAKKWWDNSVTVKSQRKGCGAFEKERRCHPISPTSTTNNVHWSPNPRPTTGGLFVNYKTVTVKMVN